MCGRYTLIATQEQIKSHYQLVVGLQMVPKYNIAPSQTVIALRDKALGMDFFRWGLIPYWSKAQTTPAGQINARFETAFEKPMFKQAYQKRRLLIPASGFFEWKLIRGRKQPYYFKAQEPLISFAGLWEKWVEPNGQSIETCAILTREAFGDASQYHDRMPCIVKSSHYKTWLNIKTASTSLEECLAQELPLEIFPVSSRMSSPQTTGPECVQSISIGI